MPVERATVAFKERRLNCAQSVLHAFQPLRAISDDEILQAKGLGGGRAEAGACGALHAALMLADSPDVRQRFREAFVAAAGSDTCREIRQAKQLSCLECVQLATRLLAEHSEEGK
jgi:hypothetical protein